MIGYLTDEAHEIVQRGGPDAIVLVNNLMKELESYRALQSPSSNSALERIAEVLQHGVVSIDVRVTS